MSLYKIIKVSSSLGAPNYKSGMEMGPDVLSMQLINKNSQHIDKNPVSLPIPDFNQNHQSGKFKHIKSLPEVKKICRNLKEIVHSEMRSGFKPLVLMGDDSSTIGFVYGILSLNVDVGIVWFDAHGDINTPDTSPSGCFYGMGLAHAIGRGNPEILELNNGKSFVDTDSVIMIGQRDLDSQESMFIKKHTILNFSASVIQIKFLDVLEKIRDRSRKNNIKNLILHYDLDVFDPKVNPAVYAQTPGGLSVDEINKLTEFFKKEFDIIGLSIANYIPTKDQKGRVLSLLINLIALIVDN